MDEKIARDVVARFMAMARLELVLDFLCDVLLQLPTGESSRHLAALRERIADLESKQQHLEGAFQSRGTDSQLLAQLAREELLQIDALIESKLGEVGRRPHSN